MTSKPSSGDRYESGQLERVKRTCLYMATRLGDLLDEVVVVGGLVPGLLVDQDSLPRGCRFMPAHLTWTWGWRWPF